MEWSGRAPAPPASEVGKSHRAAAEVVAWLTTIQHLCEKKPRHAWEGNVGAEGASVKSMRPEEPHNGPIYRINPVGGNNVLLCGIFRYVFGSTPSSLAARYAPTSATLCESSNGSS
jgi:hypothetical protein